MVNKNLYVICALSFISCSIYAQNNLNSNDSTVTIEPGQQTAAANLRHQKFCETIGGTDVTNDSKVTLSSGAKDGIACSMPANVKAQAGITLVNDDGSLGKFTPNGESPQQISGKIDKSLAGVITSLIAPSGTIPFQQNAYVTGIAVYTTPNAAFNQQTTVSVPSDKCTMTNSGPLPPNATKTITVTVLCTAWVSGSVQSSTQGCVNSPGQPWGCQTAYGSINQPVQ